MKVDNQVQSGLISDKITLMFGSKFLYNLAYSIYYDDG